MRVLGVDPGLRTTGYGVDRCRRRTFRLGRGRRAAPENRRSRSKRRLAQLHEAMLEVVRATRPDCMVVEELWSAPKHPPTAVLMGHARGVIALAAGQCAVALRRTLACDGQTRAHRERRGAQRPGQGDGVRAARARNAARARRRQRRPRARARHSRMRERPTPLAIRCAPRRGANRVFAHRRDRCSNATARSCASSRRAHLRYRACRPASRRRSTAAPGAPLALEIYAQLQIDGNSRARTCSSASPTRSSASFSKR